MIAKVPLHSITRDVCERHSLTIERLRAQNRFRFLVRARQELMYLLRETKLYTWAKIGTHLKRDHTTVCHGYEAHKRRLARAAKC